MHHNMYNATKLRNIEGFSKDGDFVHTVQITGPDGMKASVLTLGARLLDLRMPDGRPLTLSLDNLADIESDAAYIGSVVGRVCNRIRGGTFCIGEEKTQLEKNCKDAHHIHGGRKAWDKRLFTVSKRSESSVELFLYSPDKDQGYPSAVEVYVTYKLRGDGELFISLQTTNVGTKPTITNMTVSALYCPLLVLKPLESELTTLFLCSHLLYEGAPVLRSYRRGRQSGELRADELCARASCEPLPGAR